MSTLVFFQVMTGAVKFALIVTLLLSIAEVSGRLVNDFPTWVALNRRRLLADWKNWQGPFLGTPPFRSRTNSLGTYDFGRLVPGPPALFPEYNLACFSLLCFNILQCFIFSILICDAIGITASHDLGVLSVIAAVWFTLKLTIVGKAPLRLFYLSPILEQLMKTDDKPRTVDDLPSNSIANKRHLWTLRLNQYRALALSVISIGLMFGLSIFIGDELRSQGLRVFHESYPELREDNIESAQKFKGMFYYPILKGRIELVRMPKGANGIGGYETPRFRAENGCLAHAILSNRQAPTEDESNSSGLLINSAYLLWENLSGALPEFQNKPVALLWIGPKEELQTLLAIAGWRFAATQYGFVGVFMISLLAAYNARRLLRIARFKILPLA